MGTRGLQIGGLLRRGVVVCLLLAVVGAVAGAWLGARRDEMHSATATVLVSPLEGNPFSPDAREGLLNLETEAKLVASDAVAKVVAEETGLSAEQVLVRLTVEVPPNTQLLRITVANRDPELARTLADSFATEYLTYRKDRTASTVFTRRAHLTEEMRSMTSQLGELTREQEQRSVGSERRALLDQQVTGLLAQIAQVQAEQTTLGYVSQDPGQVVTPAQSDAAGPISGMALGAVAGGLFGALVGAGVVYARLRRADKVGSRLDLEASGHEVIGTLEQADRIRARLLTELPRHPVTALLADVGATPNGEATRHGGEALAASLARARLRTIHVVLDGEPAHHLGKRRDMTLVDVLSGEAHLEKALVAVADFHQRAFGGHPGDGQTWGDLLASPDFGGLVSDLRERADVVLFTGLRLPGAEGDLLVGRVDAAVLVATSGQSTNGEVALAVAAVTESNARLLGLVHQSGARHARSSRRSRSEADDS